MDQKKVKQVKSQEKNEATLHDFNQKLDKKMDTFMKKWFLEKIINHKIVKDILWSKTINDINTYLQPYLKKIFLVMWRISIIGWVVWIFWWLSGLGMLFRFNFWIIFFLYTIITLVFSLLAIITWYGMINFKKWTVLLVVVEFLLSCLSFLFILLSANTGLWSAFINILLSFLLTILLIKNKEIFKN